MIGGIARSLCGLGWRIIFGVSENICCQIANRLVNVQMRVGHTPEREPKPHTTMTATDEKLTATQARYYAKRIAAECSQCFTSVQSKKAWGGWEININGGRGACYGRTVSYVDSAEEILKVFAND